MLLRVGAPAFAGVSFLVLALGQWVFGLRRHSLALRWFSLVYVALALCAFIAASGQLTHLYASDLWVALELAALFLAVCLAVVAGVIGVREAAQAARLQRRRP